MRWPGGFNGFYTMRWGHATLFFACNRVYRLGGNDDTAWVTLRAEGSEQFGSLWATQSDESGFEFYCHCEI